MTSSEAEKLKSLYELYEQPMYRIAFAVLRQQEAAEDAVSDAFMRIIKKLGKLGEPDSPRTKKYIIKVIRSTSINQYNKNKQFLSRELPIDDETMQLPDLSTDVESEIIGRQPTEILNSLSETERSIVELRCMEGRSWREIADILSVTETAARKRFERIRKKLISMKGVVNDEKIRFPKE